MSTPHTTAPDVDPPRFQPFEAEWADRLTTIAAQALAELAVSIAARALDEIARAKEARLIDAPQAVAEFAKLLLEMPDLPICVPAVKEYDDSDESAKTPIVTKSRGEHTGNDEPCDLLMITHAANTEGEAQPTAQKP